MFPANPIQLELLTLSIACCRQCHDNHELSTAIQSVSLCAADYPLSRIGSAVESGLPVSTTALHSIFTSTCLVRVLLHFYIFDQLAISVSLAFDRLVCLCRGPCFIWKFSIDIRNQLDLGVNQLIQSIRIA